MDQLDKVSELSKYLGSIKQGDVERAFSVLGRQIDVLQTGAAALEGIGSLLQNVPVGQGLDCVNGDEVSAIFSFFGTALKDAAMNAETIAQQIEMTKAKRVALVK